MKKETFTVKARHLKEGDIISYDNPRWNVRVDGVQFTRDGEVRVYIGDYSTGAEWYGPDDLIEIIRN